MSAETMIGSIMDIFYHLYEIEIVQSCLMFAVFGGIVALLCSIIHYKIK